MEKIIVDESLLIRYFSGEIVDEDAQYIEEWITSSEENKDIAKQIYYIYFASETLQAVRQTDSEDALRRVSKRMKKQKRMQWMKQMQRIAAVLFIPLFLSTLYLLNVQLSGEESFVELRTNPGMVTSITLPDSTKVWLNSESYIKYPVKFRGKTREVMLDGEAYFDVQKDDDKKFIVSTAKNIKIEVLGTKFNVEAYNNNKDVIATLVSGQVNLLYTTPENNTRNYLMSPNQRAVVDLENQTVKTISVNVEPDIAWKDGKIIFNNTSLEDALKILSKRFNVEFIINNPKLKEYSFSGTFVHQRLDRILEHFKISSNIKSRYTITEENNNKEEKSIIEIY